jgi:hypothetical protein
VKNRQRLYVVAVMQPKALAKSLQEHCQLENQEAFSVCCNILLVACSGKEKKIMKTHLPF